MLPALLWLCVCGAGLWEFIQLSELVLSPAATWLDVLFVGVFLALAIFGLGMAYKEYQRVLPALRAETALPIGAPRLQRSRVPPGPARFPLADAPRLQLDETLLALKAAGVLQPNEVTLEQAIACAEANDEYRVIGIVEMASLLAALHSEREHPFANLAFFAEQVEVSESDIVTLVREFARLSGQLQQLGTVRLHAIGGGRVEPALRGEFPSDNAVVEFQLSNQHHAVPFVMYAKNVPGRLIERLASVFTRDDDARCYVSACFDQLVILSYLPPEKVAVLNSALPGEPPWFEALD